MHIAIIGTGRVGQMLAFALSHEPYISKLSLSDIRPGLSQAVAEEIRHATAGNGLPIQISHYEKNEEISGAEIIIVTAGAPRTPQMADRKELTRVNAKIIKSVAESVAAKNSSAKYIIVTNPVDALATLFSHYSKIGTVLSTGTSLDTLRFKSELAKHLKVPVNEVEGFVAGEHGQSAVFLWSTVKIYGKNLESYLAEKKLNLGKKEIIAAVKSVSEMIIKVIGGTAQGPATAFRQIIRSIALDEKRLISVAVPYKILDLPIPVHTSIPLRLGKDIGPTLEAELIQEERQEIKKAAQFIWQTYQEALSCL